MRTKTLLAIFASCALALVTAACIIGPKHDDPDTVGGPTKDASVDMAFDPETGSIDAANDAPPPPSDTATSTDTAVSDTGAPTDAATDSSPSDASSDAPSDAPSDGDAPPDAGDTAVGG